MLKRIYTSLVLTVLFCLTYAAYAEEPILVIEPQGHSAMINEVIFIPDGTSLISVSDDKTIRLWDVESGELRETLRGQIGDGPEGKLYAAALSPNGAILAAGGYTQNDEIRLFRVTDGKQIGFLKGHDNVIYALAFSPDSRRLASGSMDKTVRVWDVSPLTDSGQRPKEKTDGTDHFTGEALAILEGHDDSVYGIAFSQDGTKLISVADDDIGILWDWKSRRMLAKLEKHTDDVNAVAFAPSGQHIVSGGFDGKIILWNGNGEFIKKIDEIDDDINTVSFSADSKKLVAVSQTSNYAYVYAIPSSEKLSSFHKHDNTVLASAFYGNELIATAGGDDSDIYLWDAASGKIRTHIVGKGERIWAAAFGSGQAQTDGLTVAFGNKVKSGWKVNDYGVFEKSFNFLEMSLSPKPPGEELFRRTQNEYQGKTLKKISNVQLEVTDKITINLSDSLYEEIRAYSFTPDGRIVIGGSYNLKLFDTDGSFLREFIGHTGEVWALSVSQDGRILASASDDQTIKLWNIASGECLATLFVASDKEWVCWTPQGYYAASAGGEKYIGWHINQGMEKEALFYPVSVFRDQYLNPELVKRTIALGSFEVALKQLNQELPASKQILARQSPALPPLVTWLSPQEASLDTAEQSIKIKAKISSHSKIREAKLLLNGKPFVELSPTGRSSEMYWEVEAEVPLAEDRNDLVIFAANELAGTPSNERIVLYNGPGSLHWKPSLYMVAVGIANYPNADLRLNYPDDDARAMSDMFRQQQGKLFKKVETRELYDENATRGNILDALEWLQQQTTQHDVAVIFFAAHGYNESDNYYLLPVDGDPERLRRTAVDWRDFVDVLGNLPSRVIFFLDSCHSGQLGSNLYALARGDSDNTEAIRELASAEYGVVILAASTGKEASLESSEWGHGAFTRALLDGLQEGRADQSQDGIVHLRELDHYIAERVKNLTKGKQHPTTARPSTISRFPIVQTE